jgi:hypothetical protein
MLFFAKLVLTNELGTFVDSFTAPVGKEYGAKPEPLSIWGMFGLLIIMSPMLFVLVVICSLVLNSLINTSAIRSEKGVLTFRSGPVRSLFHKRNVQIPEEGLDGLEVERHPNGKGSMQIHHKEARVAYNVSKRSAPSEDLFRIREEILAKFGW